MITQTQINDLKKASDCEGSINKLLEKHQSELDFKAIASGKKIKVKLSLTDGAREVLRTPIAGTGMSFGKMIGLKRMYAITHNNTGYSIVSDLPKKTYLYYFKEITKFTC